MAADRAVARGAHAGGNWRAGAAGGFLFRERGRGSLETNDAGRTWNPIFDSQTIASIGAIAIAPSDSNVIYVGSGEADMRSSISYGDGMYKSTDGGKNWAHIGLEDSRQIGRIIVDPKDTNRVFVAALGHAYGRTRSAVCFVRRMAGRAGKKFCLRMKTLARSMWHSNPAIQK